MIMTDMENRPLWSDSNPYDPMTCEMYEEARAMYNLYEDIQCLKEDIKEQQKENKHLQEALVYVAFASHSTPLHMLPKGIILGGNDTVEVKLNAGLTVIAKHEI